MLLAAAVGNAGASTLMVTTAADSGPGSLRSAIQSANAQAGSDVIDFSIGSGSQTIAPASPLPAITGPVVVDGTTQPGFSGSPLIRVDGASTSSASGLLIEANSVTVRGLALTGWAVGIQIDQHSANRIVGNEIGTHSGAALPNGTGVYIGNGSSNNTVGGTTAADRNLISGNTGSGVFLIGAQTTSNVIEGNYIGTNAAGTGAQPNADRGIYIVQGASGNMIGGPAAGAGNLISGNTGDGVEVSDAGTTANVIAGNYVGINAAGTAAVANRRGVLVTGGATHTTIGGTTPGARNVVAGNRDDGVELFAAGATGNVVEGNYIGTNAPGTAAVANGGPDGGVYIGGNAANNTVGGTAPGAGNLISGNAQNGVDIYAPGTTGNLVQGNYIGTNAAGTAAIGNAKEGVFLEGGATGNTIGGTTPSARNVISGNVFNGVEALSGANANLIEGNYIGTNPAGTGAVGNVDGVAISDAPNNTIGGTAAGAGNLISGNTDSGVAVYGSSATGNVLQGNLIGTTADGSGVLANLGTDAISIGGGAAHNTIGGTAVGAGNTIANAGNGVEVNGASTTGEQILGNAIFANSHLGIALTSGGNATAPAPTISSVSSGPSSTTIAGTATPGTARVEAFSNSGCSDPEGAHYLGSVSTSGGSWSLTVGQVAAGRGVTATATDPSAANTSSFSACVLAPTPSSTGPPPPNQPPPNQPPPNSTGPPVASFVISPASPSTGQSVSFDASSSSGSIVSYSWWFDDGAGASGVSAQHTYTAPGSYTAILTVTDASGNTSRTGRSFTVSGLAQQPPSNQPPPNQPPPNQPPPNQTGPPSASFVFSPASPLSGQTVSFDGSSSSGSLVSYSWWFDDGATGSGVTAEHAYATPGAYSPILTVTDSNGNTSRTGHSVTVSAQSQPQTPNQPPPPPNQSPPPPNQPPPNSSGPPVASFVFSPATPSAGQTVSFDASSSSGSIVSYSWWFDDGAVGTGISAQHAYPLPGTYTPILTVTDANGNTSRTGRSITIF
ncbi:MAG TPA: PKD domain-containing protein [Solirubrobacteraceae bacterium]|nr:PKD domain-containing protein [Solirubrobacteraceae bacterium]